MEHLAAVVNAAVANLIGVRLLFRFFANRRFAKFHAARAQVREFAVHNPICLATPPEFQAVVAEMRKPAILEKAIPRAFAPNRPRHADGSLAKPADLRFGFGGNARLVLAAMKSFRK